jgi:two-component system, cell cycle sensor histidine kinase and response regulator CckA
MRYPGRSFSVTVEPSFAREVAVSTPAERVSVFSPWADRTSSMDARRRYAVAIAAVFLAACLRLIIVALLGQRFLYVTFFMALFVSAWYGGFGPSVLALVLSLFVVYLALPPVERVFDMTSQVTASGVLFAVIGIATAWLGETRLRAFRRAQDHARLAAEAANRAEEERLRAEDEAIKAEEAAAESEQAAQEAAEALSGQLRAEEAVRRSELELSDFFENASVGIHWLSADGTIIRSNRAEHEMLGYEPPELLGRNAVDCYADPDAARDILRRLTDGETLNDYPARLRCKDGSTRDVLISTSAYRDNGRFVHARGFVRDITEQKRAEEAVRSLQRLESVGQLAGGVAHEVNNQMTVVLGAADFILRRADVSDTVRTDVEIMRAAAQRSAGITAQLLAFGRRQILRPEVVVLQTVVEEFLPVLQRTLGERYEVTFEPSPNPSRVRADRRQLEQVLLNLALNAADAMPDGGRLWLRTARVELTESDPRLPLEPSVRAGIYVEFAMTDEGVGMDNATLERVFEPFFTTKGPGKGTGLGLSTVYGIIRQSGGYVAARSAPGQGTTFLSYLPVTGETTADPADLPKATRSGGRETVLVVEDQPEVRQMAVRALKAEGYEVVEAKDGRDALDILAADRPPVALVVTDLALPRIDGLTLARELATVLPDVPVLMMTGYTSSELMRRSAMARGHPLLEKPFTADELARRVRGALDGGTP